MHKSLCDRLDVGCGTIAIGSVNCDLSIREGMNPKEIPNFVLCDAQYLPFQTNYFKEVYCSHVIEHVDNPGKLMREVLRVTFDKAVLYCPHGLGDHMKNPPNPSHKHHFTGRWFEHAIHVLGCNGKCTVNRSKGVPFMFFSFFQVPFELKIELYKMGNNEDA